MDIRLVVAEAADQAVIENLLQFYQYDFSEIMGGDVNARGLFEFVSIEGYWADSRRHAFLVTVDGLPAGFALIGQQG